MFDVSLAMIDENNTVSRLWKAGLREGTVRRMFPDHANKIVAELGPEQATTIEIKSTVCHSPISTGVAPAGGYRGVAEKIKDALGIEALDCSIAHPSLPGSGRAESMMVEMLDTAFRFRPIRNGERPRIIEIGTHFGISTAILCRYGFVDTFDIEEYPEREKVWEVLEVGSGDAKFHHISVDSRTDLPENARIRMANEYIYQYIKDMDFDFAFIDGNHEYESVQRNFDAVKKCGRVLFHDYTHNTFHTGRTVRFVDEVAARQGEIFRNEPFVLWLKRR